MTSPETYSEAGIERANEEQRDVMTAQALPFWQNHAQRRQTIIYAVSVDHAHNLAAVFNDAGISVGVMLGDTPSLERDELSAIERQGESLRGEINGLGREMETRLSTVERQQAKLEGPLEGLREAITGRKAA